MFAAPPLVEKFTHFIFDRTPKATRSYALEFVDSFEFLVRRVTTRPTRCQTTPRCTPPPAINATFNDVGTFNLFHGHVPRRSMGSAIAHRCIWIRVFALLAGVDKGGTIPTRKVTRSLPTLGRYTVHPRRCVAIKSSFPQSVPSAGCCSDPWGRSRNDSTCCNTALLEYIERKVFRTIPSLLVLLFE